MNIIYIYFVICFILVLVIFVTIRSIIIIKHQNSKYKKSEKNLYKANKIKKKI